MQKHASHHLARAYYSLGDFDRAAELWRRNVEAADRESGTPSPDWRIRSQAWLARTLSDLEVYRLAGCGEETWQHAHQARDLARQQKARGDAARALHQLGVVHAHTDPPMPR